MSMTLSVGDRRQISNLAWYDPDYRMRLKKDPRRAVSILLGRLIFEGTKFDIIEEEADWAFVLLPPEAIEAELPAATDIRSAMENDVYTLLRDDPAALPAIQADPAGFLRARFDVEVPGVALYEERDDVIRLVLYHSDHEADELPDSLLDLVVGANGSGDPNCQSGYITNPYNSNPPPQHAIDAARKAGVSIG